MNSRIKELKELIAKIEITLQKTERAYSRANGNKQSLENRIADLHYLIAQHTEEIESLEAQQNE